MFPSFFQAKLASKADCLSLQHINKKTMAEFYHNMVPWFIFVSFKEILHSLLTMKLIHAHCRKTGKAHTHKKIIHNLTTERHKINILADSSYIFQKVISTFSQEYWILKPSYPCVYHMEMFDNYFPEEWPVHYQGKVSVTWRQEKAVTITDCDHLSTIPSSSSSLYQSGEGWELCFPEFFACRVPD